MIGFCQLLSPPSGQHDLLMANLFAQAAEVIVAGATGVRHVRRGLDPVRER